MIAPLAATAQFLFPVLLGFLLALGGFALTEAGRVGRHLWGKR